MNAHDKLENPFWYSKVHTVLSDGNSKKATEALKFNQTFIEEKEHEQRIYYPENTSKYVLKHKLADYSWLNNVSYFFRLPNDITNYVISILFVLIEL